MISEMVGAVANPETMRLAPIILAGIFVLVCYAVSRRQK